MRPFEKWEGLGNDFILVEGPVERELAVALCDRRRGIGADGVLSITRDEERVAMVVTNADGSRPEMCGNGLRCVAGFIARRGDLARGEVVVATDAGERRCLFSRVDRSTYLVEATMGRAKIGEAFTFEAARPWSFLPVDVGNPHAVSFDLHDDADLDVVGPALERHLPGGVNVELCAAQGAAIEVRVWERGVGRTLACGTGACAVAAAAASLGRAPFDAPIEVILPGGPLSITVSADLSLRMQGPARRVFSGALE